MLPENSSYTLKSAKNNYCQRYNVMWCDIFHHFVRGNKKKKTCNGKKLLVKHKKLKAILPTSDPYFDTLKTCGLFYLNFFPYIKIFFFLFVVVRTKSLSFHGKDFNFANGIVFLFLISLWVMLSRNSNAIFMFNNYDMKA